MHFFILFSPLFQTSVEPVVLGLNIRPYGTRTNARTRLHLVQDFRSTLRPKIVHENLTQQPSVAPVLIASFILHGVHASHTSRGSLEETQLFWLITFLGINR